MRVFVVTPPQPVITLAEAKDHLRVRHDSEDTLITRLVKTATAHIDGPDRWLGRAIGVQTLEARFDSYGAPGQFELACPPVVSVTSVKYLDSDRAEQTIDAADYELIERSVYPISSGSYPWSGGWAGREAIRIRYQAGYAAVPEDIKAAILLMTGDLYANRETSVTGTIAASIPMSTTVDNLLSPFRVYA